MKWFTTLPLLAACLVLSTPPRAAGERKPPEPKPADKVPATDQEFVAWAVAFQTAEIKNAELALKQTGNDELKKLSQVILEHDAKLRDALREKAKELKVAAPDGPGEAQRATYERLGKFAGPAFDREYVPYLVDSHEKAVRLFEKWSRDGRDPGVRDLAARGLVTTREHLEAARKLAAALKP